MNQWLAKKDWDSYRIDYAIFKGQKDALEGNIVIAKNADGVYDWINSPWDSGKKPTYSRSYVKDETGNIIYF